MKHSVLFILGMFFCALSCSKEEVNQLPVAKFVYKETADRFDLISKATDAESEIVSYKWETNSDLITINSSEEEIASFKIPELDAPVTIAISHTVSDGVQENSITENIQLPVLTDIRKWGLGINLEKEHSNNVDYEWYMDQMNTGQFSAVNCAPTAVTMAIKWANEDFTGTPEDARAMYRPTGGGWYTDDIIGYLHYFSIQNQTVEITNTSELTVFIDNGEIIILGVDIHYVREASNDTWHVDKYYNVPGPGAGHAIVVKGYKIVDNELFFEIYDPSGLGAKYSDNTFKGKDRYYRSSDLNWATDVWWKYAIRISKDKMTKSSRAVDPKTIEHKYID